MNKFKCKDEIIYRHYDDMIWNYGIYSHKIENGHFLVGTAITNNHQILPYKGNEHLVGTTDSPDEEIILKEGELVVVSDEFECLYQGQGTITKFNKITKNQIYTYFGEDEYDWEFVIPFSKFNLNNMEETRKHILCVKNGKLIRCRD